MDFSNYLDMIRKNIERFEKFITRHENDEKKGIESHVATLMEKQTKMIQTFIELNKDLSEEKPKTEEALSELEKLKKKMEAEKEEKEKKMLEKALAGNE